jgi:N-glycosylase/DNA lyase
MSSSSEVLIDAASAPQMSAVVDKRIIVDQPQVERVLGELMCAYEADAYPYNLDTTRVPQDHRHLPENLEIGSVDHASYLFYLCCYMRGGIKSVDAAKRVGDIYVTEPALFVAEKARLVAAEHIAEVLSQHGLGFQQRVSKQWVENSQRLAERYGSNPINIFEGVSDYETALARVKNDKTGGGFIGFQEKMVSMLLYYLMDEKMIEYFDFPLPVDLHVLRITIANNLLQFEGYDPEENLLTDELRIIARRLYHQYAVEKGINTIKLCNALWLLSESLCGQQAGNITLEPEGRKKRKGRKTLLVPQPIIPSSKQQRAAYQKSCGMCPVESTCQWNVPGKSLYVHGGLGRRGERPKVLAADLEEAEFPIKVIRIQDVSDGTSLRVRQPKVAKPKLSEAELPISDWAPSNF